MIRFLLFFLIVAGMVMPECGSAFGDIPAQVQNAADKLEPAGAVMVIVDGFGASYASPELSAFDAEGRQIPSSTLFNLTGGGIGYPERWPAGHARVIDVRAPNPVTGPGHSVIVTGFSGASEADVALQNASIFDLARNNGYLCLAIMQRGDGMQILSKQDGVLYFDDNAINGAKAVAGSRKDLPEDLRERLLEWRDAFPAYTRLQDVRGYQGYNRWALLAATDMVWRLSSRADGRKFLLTVNVGAVDSAGHYLGPNGYLQTISALDAPIGELAFACIASGVLLIVTADHGMSFSRYGPRSSSKGGHAGDQYKDRLESRRVPLFLAGPGVDSQHVGGVWSQADIAPTVKSLLGLKGELSLEDGRPIPVKVGYDLTVKNCSGNVTLKRQSGLAVNGIAFGQSALFHGLGLGRYLLEHSGKAVIVDITGDKEIDMSDKQIVQTASPWPAIPSRYLIAALLIAAINICGILLIWRIIGHRLPGKGG